MWDTLAWSRKKMHEIWSGFCMASMTTKGLFGRGVVVQKMCGKSGEDGSDDLGLWRKGQDADGEEEEVSGRLDR